MFQLRFRMHVSKLCNYKFCDYKVTLISTVINPSYLNAIFNL